MRPFFFKRPAIFRFVAYNRTLIRVVFVHVGMHRMPFKYTTSENRSGRIRTIFIFMCHVGAEGNNTE